MKMKSLILVASIAAMASMVGCTSTPGDTTTAYRTTTYYNHPYDYYYYPSVSVYFHITSGDYFYRDGPRWIRVKTLPPRFYLDPRDRVQIRINTSTPYVYHNQHRVKYQKQPAYQFNHKLNQQERNANLRRYKNNQKR